MKHIVKLDNNEIEALVKAREIVEELIYYTSGGVIPECAIMSDKTGEIIEKEELSNLYGLLDTLADDFREFEQVYC